MSNIPEGYKQTEVGVIPEDWDVKSIEEMSISNGLVRGPFGGALKKEFFVPTGYKIYEQRNAIYCDVTLGTYYVNNSKFVELKRFEVKKGDFIVSCSGTIGKIYQIPENFENGIINQALLKITINNSLFSDQFFNHYFKWEIFQQRIINNTQGGAMKNIIGMMEFRKTLIPIPPTKSEQHAIATVLSDTDALIEHLGELIAKKIAIKQGAMQHLLTGKKRLPGFGGEWEVKKLDEIIVCLDNLRVPLNDEQRSKIKGDYPYCGANGVLDYVNDYVIDNDIILIAEDGGYFDEYAYRPIAYRMYGKSWVNNHAHILKAKEHVDQNFIYYSLVNKNILSFLASGTRAKLNKSEMYKIEINISKDKTEQTAIATILSEMDAEIESLEQKRDKYAMIKQGMMQELLTGKTRLV